MTDRRVQDRQTLECKLRVIGQLKTDHAGATLNGSPRLDSIRLVQVEPIVKFQQKQTEDNGPMPIGSIQIHHTGAHQAATSAAPDRSRPRIVIILPIRLRLVSSYIRSQRHRPKYAMRGSRTSLDPRGN